MSDNSDLHGMTFEEVCEASITNGVRATKRQMMARRIALWTLVHQFQPATVRQIFHQATVKAIVEKLEAGYQQVQRCLVDLRRNYNLPYDWITDHTRFMREPRSYDSLENALSRRNLWAEADCHVEIWCEKNALTGVLYPVTSEFNVPFCIASGFSSITFLNEVGMEIEAEGKPAFIYHFGDFDPWGRKAAEKIETGLRQYAPNRAPVWPDSKRANRADQKEVSDDRE
jgi:hypothetical protein